MCNQLVNWCSGLGLMFPRNHHFVTKSLTLLRTRRSSLRLFSSLAFPLDSCPWGSFSPVTDVVSFSFFSFSFPTAFVGSLSCSLLGFNSLPAESEALPSDSFSFVLLSGSREGRESLRLSGRRSLRPPSLSFR